MASNPRINELYDSVKQYHGSHHEMSKDGADFLKLTESFNVKLRPYQEAAVVWMLERERSTDNIVSFEDYQVVYPKGGVLADEMGLGKTIEMLACILCNPCPSEIHTKKTGPITKMEITAESNDEGCAVKNENGRLVNGKGRPKKRKSSEMTAEERSEDKPKKQKTGLFSPKFDSLRAWYEQSIGSNTPSPVKRYCEENQSDSKLRCFCKGSSEGGRTITCKTCDTEQHTACVGSPNPDEYLCPWCWTKKTPIKTKATLIVSPTSISNQWMDEVKQRVKDSILNVMVYEGVRNRKYIQPSDLADYDIIITSYQTLSTELNYVWEEDSSRKLRHAKKYFSPASPLTCVEWWRLVLDEAQMVEGTMSKTATMACRLTSVNKWAVSGTPVQKTIDDLYGLVKFLNVEPFTEPKEWTRLLQNENMCFDILAPILWRSIKKDVFDQIGVPPQTVIEHWLRFSPVEGHFYQYVHKGCAEVFKLRFNKLINPTGTRIKDINRAELNKLLNPLLKLRQACTHPQVIRGKYMKLKHTLTMEELMLDMVAKAKVDLINALRAVVASLNGLAGINWLNFNYHASIECYRKILAIGREYEHLVKIDSLQMIHTLYNLAEALEDHGNSGVARTLRDSELRQEALALEENYLKKTEEQVNIAKAQTFKLTELVDQIADGRTLGYSSWWESLLREIKGDGELLSRITTYLEDNKIFGQAHLSSRVQSLPGALRVLAIWLGDSDVARLDALKSLKTLHAVPKDVLSNEAVNCHLGINKKKKKKKKDVCTLCSSSDLLKKYETLIFSITEESKDEELYESEEENDLNVEGNKLLADLKDVEFFSKKKEGNWKPSLQEGILRVLASYVKVRKMRDDWIQDANKHLLLLGAVKKEFKSLRAEWQKISNLVAAKDEISMAKLRMRLPTPEEESRKGNSSVKTKTADVINVIHPHEIPYQTTILESDLSCGQTELKRTAGILLYLKNLQKNGHVENEPCPVCQDKLNEKWSVLRCGHCICFECIPSLLKLNHGIAECPMCRFRTSKDEVSFVVANQTSSGLTDEIRLVGSYSTKVEAVTTQLLHLRAKDPDVKVIIFSTWEKVLDVVGEALGANSISFRRLSSLTKHRNGLSQFKSGPVTALLIPLVRGSKGLNIVEATHVFLVEPILNPADELQAVGRVHRIGQTKPTFVHRFIVHNTVEEKMAVSINVDGWADGNVTISELHNLFRISDDSESTSPLTAEDTNEIPQ